MIGRCIKKVLADLAPTDAEHVQRYVHLEEVDLVIGREYLILGVVFRDGHPWFLVCEDESEEYPKPHFAQLFTLVDNRIPPGWSLATEHLNVGPVAILPEKWAAESNFLEKLVDAEPGAVATFDAIKKQLSAWHRM
jgi:hypothetical protein